MPVFPLLKGDKDMNDYNEKNIRRGANGKEKESMFTVMLFLLPLAAVVALSGVMVYNGENWPMCFFPVIIVFGFCVYNTVPAAHRTQTAVFLILFEALACFMLYRLSREYPDNFEKMSDNFGGGVMGSIFTCVGLGLTIVPLILNIRSRMKCSKKVQATTIDIENKSEKRKSNGTSYYVTLYCPVYKYVYNGVSYIKSAEYFENKIKYPLNSVHDIYIDPNDPYCIHEPRSNVGVIVMTTFAGLAFTAGGLAFFITSFIIL